jgi:anti-anti-sigma regulatory factor
MAPSTRESSIAANSQVPISIVGRMIVAHLIDNFDQADLETLETRLLARLVEQPDIRGVVFNFNEVTTSDRFDLERLQAIFTAIRLVGGRVGLCGINPGLAAVIVNAGLDYQRETIGHDLDDLIAEL